MTDLLEICSNSAKHASKIEFVNNINILIHRHDFKQNCKVLEQIHQKYLEQAGKYEAMFTLQKYELVHFAREQKAICAAATLDLKDMIIKPTEAARILGIQVDLKLS